MAGRWRRSWPWLAASLSGGLLTFSFPPFGVAHLCWVGLTPLIAAIWLGTEPGERWRPALLGYTAGLVFFWGAFSWLITVTGLGWFVLAFYLALYFAFWGWFLGTVARARGGRGDTGKLPPILRSRHNLRLCLLLGAAWVMQEALRGIVFSGFGWNGPGVALYRETPFLQIAEFTGTAGVSFMVVFANAMLVLTIWRLVREAGRVRMRPHWDYSLTVAAVMLVFGFGVWRMNQPRPTSVPLKVASIQANIPQNQKFDRAFEDEIMGRYRHLTGAAAALAPDLVLWPEAATPRPMFADYKNRDFVIGQAKITGALLLGTLDFDEHGEYNAAMLWQGGNQVQIYRKLHLVPFGEFIPFRHSFPLFAAIVGDLVPGDIVAGKEPVVFELAQPAVKIAPLICFEDSLGMLTRSFVQRGAQVLVNITNDGWFMRSAGSEQHLAQSIFRTIENRRPLIRCANNGITANIDIYGNVTESLRAPDGNPWVEGILQSSVEVPQTGRLTFYTRYGEVFSLAMSALCLTAIAWHFLARRRAVTRGS